LHNINAIAVYSKNLLDYLYFKNQITKEKPEMLASLSRLSVRWLSALYCLVSFICTCVVFVLTAGFAHAESTLPIADVHVHYSHDSVELTPPERVIELMRDANLKFALVSSSDDNGTQLLSELAPDLIIPGLRPYRRRGETQTWFKDSDALAYVETLLEKNQYATIGEFHLFGKDVELEIPRRIVELADKHNLILHAHSDADAVERLLAQSESVKVIWAHSGFDSPADIADMLSKHDRLWADLAFRSEVGAGGLSKEWRQLFEDYPDRMMLGTDTYTPERMYFYASGARTWLATLPAELAENVAWKNAYELIMPVWQANKKISKPAKSNVGVAGNCEIQDGDNTILMKGERYNVVLQTESVLEVSKPSRLTAIVCGDVESISEFKLDASMPDHGHGTNYTPSVSIDQVSEESVNYTVDGVVLHMPGTWQWEVDIVDKVGSESLQQEFILQ